MSKRNRRKFSDIIRRKQNIRNFRKRLCIFCEGITEANYFRYLARRNGVFVYIKSLGEGPKAIIKEILKKKSSSVNEFDEFWVVFDKDNVSYNNFNSAIFEANSHNINVAYSIPCFELWLLLHFKLVERNLSKNGVYKMLDYEFNQFFGKRYEKNTPQIGELLFDKISIAIKNGTYLDNLWKDKKFASHNPSTTAYGLVLSIFSHTT